MAPPSSTAPTGSSDDAEAPRRTPTTRAPVRRGPARSECRSVRASPTAARSGAAGERARADEAVELARERFIAALAAEGFRREADYREALRPQDALRALEREIAAYDQAAAAAQDRLARARSAAEGLAAPDLAALERECAEAAEVLEALLARLQQLAAQIGVVDRALAALAALDVEGQDVDARYAVYVRRQEEDIAAFRKDESIAIPADFVFDALPGLSTELRQKLERHRPASLGQAARLDGMTPAALMLLLAHVKKGAAARSA